MKKVIGWLHLWLGISSGLVVLVVALTGSLLVFEDELDPLFHPAFFYVEIPAGPRQSMDALAQTVQQQYPGYKLYDIDIAQEADRSVLFDIRKSKTRVLNVAVNPYTGKIIQAVNGQRRFFYMVLQLHRYLCMGAVGKVITSISCTVFLVLVLTGLVLWWPKRNNRKQRLQVKWNASGKRLNWDLHAVLGFYVHIIIFIIALMGLTWSYEWVNNLIFYTLDGKPYKKITAPKVTPAPERHTAYLDHVLATTDSLFAYHGAIKIRFAEKKDEAITVSRHNEDAAISNVVSFAYFEQGSGRLIKVRPYEKESRGMKARRLVYPIHTGRLLGWPTKIVALIAALVAASLPVTGLFIWLNRKRKKQPRRSAPNRAGNTPPHRERFRIFPGRHIMNTSFSITPLGDSALIIEWEQEISLPVHARVMQAFYYLQSLQLPYITDLVPAYASLTVLYNPVMIRQQAAAPAFEWLSSLLYTTLQQNAAVTSPPVRRLQIPVCYHPSLGPDIAEMALGKNISTEEIIARHTAGTYTVYMLGFLPGFPYMGKVDAMLATPRRKQPRLQVAAGSVGIAGEQTGIYPLASPGGWNIIGQTPLRLFNAALEEPCYCRPGDQVQFISISLQEFNELNGTAT